MDLKRVLYFFPLDLICVLSYKKTFICTIVFEKLFASLVDQRQVGFCHQSSPSGVATVRAKSTIFLLLGILILKLLLPSESCYYVRDFDPNLRLTCLKVSLLTKLGVFFFKEKVQVMLTWQFRWQSYMALKKYFILFVSHVIFHQSLNSRDHFYTIPKDQVPN